jgi:cardiolipin synthase
VHEARHRNADLTDRWDDLCVLNGFVLRHECDLLPRVAIVATVAFVTAHLFSLVGFVMAILLLARAAEQRRPVGSMVAWLLAILVVPYLGVPLYLVFGGRKLRQRAAAKGRLETRHAPASGQRGRLEKMLCASGAAPATAANQLVLLDTGERAFAAMRRMIQGAERSIAISTLIFADDDTGRSIAAALVQRARAGVHVRVLVDALFKLRASRRLVAELRGGGVELAWFMPIWGVPWRRAANLRLHRKLLVVDGRAAIVGGMNLAREYMGELPLPGRWRDLALELRGPAVRDVADVFESDWQFARGRQSQSPPSAAPASPGGAAHGASVQVVGSGPDAESDRIYDALLMGIFGAEHRLWIATPYFVPDEALQRALVLAVRRGVDVRVVVPRRSNHLTADLAGAPYLRALGREGGDVRCYTEMLHAKLVLIDDELSVVGSANVDMRSLFLDYELSLVTTSSELTRELDTWFRSLLERTVELAPASRTRALLEPIARLLAPLE